uniref:Uncharacterized protein n=1 Tax=Acrobeloides nanus TaxID=290746 RepID=A0A914CF88_9BILA
MWASVTCFIFLTFHHVWHVPTVEFLAVLLCIGSDPFIYMGFNKDIRNDFIEIIHGIIKAVREKLNRSRIVPTHQMPAVNIPTM